VTAKYLHNLTLLDPEAAASNRGAVLIEAGKIVEVFGEQEPGPAAAEAVALQGAALAPGFIDVHFHGELIFAPESEMAAALERTAESLLSAGTTAFLATTVAWSDARIRGFVTHCQAHLTQTRHDAAELLGCHLEGPWISPAAAGAQPSNKIRPFRAPEDQEILNFGRDLVKLVTLAPECEGAPELVDALARANIAASLGHSNARHDQIDACVKDGMTHVTHLFNAMGTMHHREPGVAGWALADDRVTCDLICDGVHVDPAMVRTASRAKGDRLLLITDQLAPPRDSPGFEFGSGSVSDDGHAIRLADGTLAGSSLTLDRAVRNAQKFGAMTRTEAIAAVTLRPAKLLGIEAERGTLRRGARADFAVLNDADEVWQSWIAGEKVFSAH